jgi:hypothetical protein
MCGDFAVIVREVIDRCGSGKIMTALFGVTINRHLTAVIEMVLMSIVHLKFHLAFLLQKYVSALPETTRMFQTII